MPDIQLLQVDQETGIISLGLGRAPKVLTGMDLLVQLVALALLKNPGQDVIDPYEGSGLRSLIGEYNFTESEEIKIAVLQRTKQVEKEIIGRQLVGVGDPSERLKSLSVLDVAADPAASKVLIRVKVVNEAGSAVDLLI